MIQWVLLRGVELPSWSLEPSPFATCVGYMRSQRMPFSCEGLNLKGGLGGRFGRMVQRAV